MRSSINKTIATALLLVFCCFGILTFSACTYIGKKLPDETTLNLEDYDLVLYDEFDKDTLDLSTWEYRHSGPLPLRDGFNHPNQVSVSNGNLVITGEYLNGEYGEGWYSGAIRPIERYAYGYFEIKCIPNDSPFFWSAFWLQSNNSYSHDLSQGGVNGAEIDIFESYKTNLFGLKNAIFSTVYCNGTNRNPDKIDKERVTKVYVPSLRTDYNTFGLMWTEEEYIFYVNGVETGRTSFGKGTSTQAEEIIVSLEIPKKVLLKKDVTTQFTVDYVKIYQLRK